MNISEFEFGSFSDWLDSLNGWVGAYVVLWLLSIIFAAIVAPRNRRIEFLLITLFILGPLGVGFAAVAQPREPSARGRNACICPRCGARQFVPVEDNEFHCWRCSQHCAVNKGVLGKKSVEAITRVQPGHATSSFGRTHVADKTATVGTSFADSANLEVDRDLGQVAWGAGPATAAAPPPPPLAGPPTAAASSSDGPPLPWEAFPPGGPGASGAGR